MSERDAKLCPKCGRPVGEAAVICPGCDFILDTGFLGGDILDEEHQLRPGQGGVPADLFNLADALILGNIGDDTSSFETSDSGFHLKKDMQAARLYVSGRSQAVMSPDAVIGLIDASEKGVRLTPFEKHILSFIDGRRPVETIRRQAGLDESEVKTALATLADKGVVKVVGRALADAADADIETAPGVANKKNPRRVRGTLVGAVVVVGDAADQAIEDAFRTQVRANSASLDLDDIDSAADIGEVFSSSDEGMPALESAESADIDSLGSFEGRRTDEVTGHPPRVPTASKSTVRPSAQKEAVNARPRATASNKTGGRLVIAEDPSDGFDDFGDVSNLATAVVQQPSISEDSLPAADASQERNNRRGGVFADGTNTGSRGAKQPVAVRAPPAPPSNLSDLEDFDAPGLDDLADSRVEPRPVLPPLPPAPRLISPAPSSPMSMSLPSLPSMSEPLQPTAASTPGLSNSEASLNEDERAAMSGGVWDEHSRPMQSTKGAGTPSTHVGAPKEFSTSLSDLLGDDVPLVDSAEATAFRPPPAPMAAVVPEPPRSDPARTEIFESKLHAPKPPVKPLADPLSIRPSAAAPPAALSEDVKSDWEDSTSRARPPMPLPAKDGGRLEAADDLYPEGDDFEASTDGQVVRSSNVSTSELRRAEPPAAPLAGIRMASVRLPAPAPAPASVSRPAKPTPPTPPTLPPAPPKVPTKQPPAPLRAAPPPPPDEDEDDDEDERDLTAPPSQEADGTHDLPESNASSAEILDSAMVIRPAARPAPRAAMAPGPRAADAPDLEVEDDFMVDPDATMNLPPRPKSLEGKANKQANQPQAKAGQAGQVAAMPSGFSSVQPPAPATPGKPRRPPTEDMRRKARNLMEQAQKDYGVGRIGAARMNAKLATIYDPENVEYRRILEAWEDKPKGSPSTASSMSRPEYVQLYEQAQDLEDEGDVDGALDVLLRGVRLAPNPAAFHNRIGVILAMRKREFDRAAAEIQKAIGLEPDNPHYRSNLGKVMQKATKRKVG